MPKSLILLLAAAVLAAAGLWLLQSSNEQGIDTERSEGMDGETEPRRGAAERRLREAPPREGGTPPAADPTGVADDSLEAHEVTPARIVQRDAMLGTVEKLTLALAAEKAAEDAESAEEEQAREEAWSEMVARIKSAVRSDPYLADVLYAKARDTLDDAMAIRAARMLQQAGHAAFVAHIQEASGSASSAKERRLALVALETREADTWLGPVSRALEGDPDPAVRDEAAGVLSRSLMDRRYVSRYAELRAPLHRGLQSEDPLDRARAARAMLGDPMASPEDLDRLRALTSDEDVNVQREAKRTLRVLEGRVERARARR